MPWRRSHTAGQIPHQTPLTTLELIYFELNHRYLHPELWTPDKPFPCWSQWSPALKQRYVAAENRIGRETLVIAMHSLQFRLSLQNYTNSDWNQLLGGLGVRRGSLRMFALSRGIPYRESYNLSSVAAILGGLIKGKGKEMPEANHPHELYLASDEKTIKRSYFTDVEGEKWPMWNIEENIYNPDNFATYPRAESWPEDWDYPHDPSDPIRDPESDIMPLCSYCCLSTHFESNIDFKLDSQPHCTCSTDFIFRKPLVEVIQYPSYPGAKGALNRGIRLLEFIPEGEILDEYTGEYIPVPDPDVMGDFGDVVYTFTCHGPPVCTQETNGELEQWGDVEDICGLKAGERGNWTKFCNHMFGGKGNCGFETRVLAGRVRILVVAKRDLVAGEELCVDYGPAYFSESR